MSYLLQVSVLMTLLYLGYKWLLAGLTFHSFNRSVLLSILLFSWVLPAFFPMLKPTPVIDVEVGFPVIAVSSSTIEEIPVQQPSAIDWRQVMIILYFAGLSVALLMTAVGIAKVWAIYRRAKKVKENRIVKVISPKLPGPFSWGRAVFLRPEDCDDGERLVMIHEKEHLRLFHWLDLIFCQINIILQWFSPAAYLIMREIKTVHEYQADGAVAESDLRMYQLMLIKKTVGSSFPTFADSLNQSQLKIRITMMLRKKSCSLRRLAVLAMPAFAAVGALVLSVPSVAQALSSIEQVETSENLHKFSISSADVQTEAADDTVLESAVESEVSRSEAIYDAEEIVMETSAHESSDEPAESEPTVIIGKHNAGDPTFFVNGVKMEAGLVKNIPPSMIASMSVVKDDPDFPDGKIMITLKKDDAAVEQIASFKGGQQSLMQFITSNVVYPKGEKTEGVKRVIVQFTINEDGTVSGARVIRGASEAFNAEAIRVVNLTSGHWEPGRNGGKPVASLFTIPISFKAE